MPPPIALSKTKILQFCQCPRMLWLDQYSPELEEESPEAEARFETGRQVGELAREIYGRDGGYRIDNQRGLRASISETASLLEAGGKEPIFEATFDYEGLTVQIDILDRAGEAPRIVEVKSSSSVKEHHLYDCAAQAWVLTQLGIPVAGVAVAHIDSSFVYQGRGRYDDLLVEKDVGDDIAPWIEAMPKIVEVARSTLNDLEEPDIPVGPHCTNPYPCPFFEHCSPTSGKYPVAGLGGDQKRLYEWINEGIRDLRDVPEEQLADDRQRLIHRQTKAEEAYIAPEIREFVKQLDFPRYYLDFETISFAIPIWKGTRPYEALPFQWSCHIESDSGDLDHEAFLDISGEAPMRACAKALVETLGDRGPVLVYSSFEKRVINGLIDRFHDLVGPLTDIRDRLVDLLPPTKQHYYHPDMQGSWSIKAVLPTVAPELSYGSLGEVRDGIAAQAGYLAAIEPDATDTVRNKLRRDLLDYCRYDSLALVKLVGFFDQWRRGLEASRRA